MEGREVVVQVEICREGVRLPEYARPGDAGMDVCAAEELLIKPGETVVVPTGLKLAIPEGYEIQVRPRSGVSIKTPLRLSNSPGTIDSGYRDEVGVIMTNTSEPCPTGEEKVYGLDERGNKKGVYRIKRGDRIAQLILQKVPAIKFRLVDSVSEIGKNRGGGFGSTGLR